MRKKALTAFRRVICVSDYMKNVLAVTGHKNLVTIPNFVDLNNEILPTIKMGRQINVKDYYDIPPQNKVILYAGRLSVEKGVGNLLWAFKHINHVLKNVYLMIIGDGPQMDILKMEINKNIETHTIFAGRVSREFVLQAIRQSDVFVLPSIWPDPCPTSVIEAMTLGKPIIGTEGGGASELVINNWNGFLVQPGNIEELATKIIQILTHDDLLEVFGKNSRLNSTQYDIQAVGPRIIQIYRDLMKDK
jgi:glycosyltransferase involved in cell wall biosynthesis